MDIQLPNKKYQIIYADPPWSYNDKLSSVSTGDFRFKGAGSVYPTQSKEWIKNLPVEEITDKDCVLFLWGTNPLLPEAFSVITAWGFKFKTVAFVWVKQTINQITVSNLGRWTMGGAEMCLLATKGHPQRICRNVRQVDYSVRGRHSEKPNKIRQDIVKLMGDLPRIELFARQRVAGWDAWGNEVESETDQNEQKG